MLPQGHRSHTTACQMVSKMAASAPAVSNSASLTATRVAACGRLKQECAARRFIPTAE